MIQGGAGTWLQIHYGHSRNCATSVMAFVADPEFTPFEIDAFGCDSQSAPALPSDPTQVRHPKRGRLHTVGREFPNPPLAGGLPWRYAEYIKRPVVSETEFAPLDLSYIGS